MTRSLFSFFAPVLSLPASLTLTANTFLLPVRGGRDLRPHRVGISPSHPDSRDQAQKEAGQKRKAPQAPTSPPQDLDSECLSFSIRSSWASEANGVVGGAECARAGPWKLAPPIAEPLSG